MRIIISIAVLALALLQIHCARNPVAGPPPVPITPLPADCVDNDCKAPEEWFKNGQTPKVGMKDFPSPTEQDECPFYKFGWQSFLYVTQSEPNDTVPRFVRYDTPNDLFPPAGGGLALTAAPPRAAAKKHILSLSVRNSPNNTRNIQAVAFEQAGSQGVVVDHNNRCLYYGQHVNPEFVDFIRNGLGLKTAEQIKDVPLGQPGFPAGCVELKSSWRVLTEEEKQPGRLQELQKSFFITDAEVPTLVALGPQGSQVIRADAGKARPEKVALVALHVVGTTPGHPEFIWASFEHVENSPTPSKSVLVLDPKEPVNNVKSFTFYTQGTTKERSNLNPINPLNPADALRVLDPTTFAAKQTLGPVANVFREFNSGEKDDGKPDADVCNLNRSVRARLAAIPSLAVWSNYQMIGAVWLKSALPNAPPAGSPTAPPAFKEDSPFPLSVTEPKPGDDIFAGEKKLSNSTMETFTQQTKANCFSCHDTHHKDFDERKSLPGLKILVSHVIRNQAESANK